MGAGFGVGLRAWYLGCCKATARRWGEAPFEADALMDRKRSGRPAVFTEQHQLRAIGFYCQSPLPGCGRWSLAWAVSYLNRHLEIIGRLLSTSTLHRILTRHSLRPHRVGYYLHISDPLFFPKMDHLIQLYLSPPPYLFCMDECSGLQAFERLAVPITDEQGTRLESEYRRHGTRDLCAIFEVSSGKVFGRCTTNHSQQTIAALLRDHALTQPGDATLHYVCDNLAGHSTALVCQTVADLAGVGYPDLKTAKERRQWLCDPGKRIVFHFTPYHGSWLNMIEIWFGILHAKCIRSRSFASADELAQEVTAFLDTWNEHFAHPFNWRYTGQGLADKVVRRLASWIRLEARSLTGKFLAKQLQLAMNIAKNYWADVQRSRWQELHLVLFEKPRFLATTLASHPKAQANLADLTEHLAATLPECRGLNTFEDTAAA
jgi:transposase